MYIIYDARHFEDYYSGLSRYCYSVLIELIRENKFSKLEVIFNVNYDYTNNPLFQQLHNTLNSKIKLVFLNAPLFSIKQNLTVAKYVNNSKCDLYFYAHFDCPVFIRKKSIFVIHDLFPLVLDSYVLKHSFLKKLYFKFIILINLLKKNSRCIAVSNTTKNDLVRIFGVKHSNKIKVIYEDSFTDIERSDKPTDKITNVIQGKNFLFYIGGRRRHKNLKQMIDIFNTMIERNLYDGYFVIAGSERNYYFDLEDYIKNNKNIIVVGKVTDDELSYLYSKMDSLFFLSKYEGFGLPIIESAKLNKKIITSNIAACGEVAPHSSLKLELSKSNPQLAKKISAYLSEDIKIDNFDYLKLFSWKNTVDYILKNGGGY